MTLHCPGPALVGWFIGKVAPNSHSAALPAAFSSRLCSAACYCNLNSSPTHPLRLYTLQLLPSPSYCLRSGINCLPPRSAYPPPSDLYTAAAVSPSPRFVLLCSHRELGCYPAWLLSLRQHPTTPYLNPNQLPHDAGPKMDRHCNRPSRHADAQPAAGCESK